MHRSTPLRQAEVARSKARGCPGVVLAEPRAALVGRVARVWLDLDLVFCNEVCRPCQPTNICRRLHHRLLRELGLPAIRFHDLSHTAATLLLSRGVHPKIASDMLGRASIANTLDIYSHVLPHMQQAASDAMQAALWGN